MTKRAKKEATPMADYINSRMAMIQMRKTTKRSALAHYKEGFVPTDHKHILTDTEITEYARRIKRLMTLLNCIALRYSMYADGMKNIFYDIHGSSVALAGMADEVKKTSVQITDCQMQISRLWKSVAKFLGDDTGERVVANDTVLEEFMKVCFSTDSYGRACDEDSILVKMPIALYNSQCVANPVFAKLPTFGGYEEVVK